MSTYRIRPGDTLWALSRKFGTSVEELVKLNGIKNPNLIIAGHTLKIPDEFSRGLGRGLLHPEGLKKPKRPQSTAQVAQQGDATPAAPKHPRPPKHPSTSPAQVAQQGGRTPSAPHPRLPPSSNPVAQQQGTSGVGTVPRGTQAQYDHFMQLIKANGGKFRTGPNQMNLLGVRHETSTHANNNNGKYDDQLVMVWKDAQGKPHVKTYTYNTEPAAAMSAYSDDVNHDGRADQGRIPAGYHEYALSSWKHGFCLRATSDFRVERDMNHDGVFTEHLTTGGGASMLFHQGGTYGTGSAGCQTFPPDQWRRFMADVRAAHGTIGYTLITDGTHAHGA